MMVDLPDTDYVAFEPVNACPLCGSPDRSIADPDASVVRCRDCGHRYVDPRPTQGEIARGYSLPAAYDDWLRAATARESMWRRRADRVLGGVPVGRLLDIGAGIGTFLAIARDRGWEAEGTEVSTTAIAHARERYGLEIRKGSLEDAAPPGPYDMISMWHVIEHVPDPMRTLRFCHGILTERGRIVLALPNDGDAAWAPTAAGNVVRRALGRQPTTRYVRLRPGVESHIQHFDPDSIRRILLACDLDVDRITVDDAAPGRSRVGSVVFGVRRLVSRWTPWNAGREMLVVATRRPVDL